MSELPMLMRYRVWADEAVRAVVRGLPEADRVAPQPIVFGSLLRTLHHVHAMDRVWRAHLLGEPHGLTTRDPAGCPAFDELEGLQRAMGCWYVDYADALAASAADDAVHFAFIGGGDGAMTRREILLHVVNHATYHRGHVADMLYRLGVRPPTTDLPVFLHAQRH